MQVRLDQLPSHLDKGCGSLYVLHGDEPLLAQEAGDAIRAAARQAGCDEREVFVVGGAHYDWGAVIGAAQSQGLFAQGKVVEIRIPTGKPGKEGGQALQQYCERLPTSVVTIITLPRLDGASLKSGWFQALDAAGVQVRLDTIERAALPAWIARRLAAQGQQVEAGEAGQRTLAYFADRVEGNLLAAHQEIQKLALLYPEGVLTLERVEAAVLDVARYDVRQLCEAVLGGQVTRALRMLEGLQAEGESAVGLLWQLAEDLRALQRVRRALDAGRPMPLALSEAQVWGVRQRGIERAAPAFSAKALTRLLAAARVCDGISKGLRHPDWPADAFEALQRLTLMTMSLTRPSPSGARSRRVPLALQVL